MGTTFTLWESLRLKDRARQVNAAVKKSYEPKAIEAATEQVAMTLDNIDINNPPKELGDFVNKLIDEKVKKSMAIAKKNMRKNCGADAKNQTSTPTGNGRNSKRESSAPSRSSNQPPKDKKQKGRNKTTQKQPARTKGKGKSQPRGPPNPSEKPPPRDKSRRGGKGTGGGKR